MADAALEFIDLIGVPFEYKGRGPDTFDCYGLLRELYRRQGHDIPDYISPTDGARISALFANQLVLWREVEPEPGAAVLIRVPGNMHCGMLIDRHRFIHTWEGAGGVCIEEIDDWKSRVLGYYRYVG
ncbi:C40 family peptidase [Chitinibacter tainanensis]|uniref:C40 family peptidase n=1 Tax=Chitinibacter tainanensis TaxID=230667 RepID=UPI00048B1515|nr:NlpC/P60 family protein [Chitinibacter tainanensis]